MRSLARAIARADVVLLSLDATQGVTAQDAHVASYILDALESVVVVVNKWDLVVKDTYTMNEHTARIRTELKFLGLRARHLHLRHDVPPRERRPAHRLRVQAQRIRRVPDRELNRLVAEAIEANMRRHPRAASVSSSTTPAR